jgi:hypothetical protein
MLLINIYLSINLNMGAGTIHYIASHRSFLRTGLVDFASGSPVSGFEEWSKLLWASTRLKNP